MSAATGKSVGERVPAQTLGETARNALDRLAAAHGNICPGLADALEKLSAVSGSK